jgi:hypothetical protein
MRLMSVSCEPMWKWSSFQHVGAICFLETPDNFQQLGRGQTKLRRFAA